MAAVIRLSGRRSGGAAGQAGAGRRHGRLLCQEVIDLVERIAAERTLRPGDMLPSQAELADPGRVGHDLSVTPVAGAAGRAAPPVRSRR